MTRPVIEYTAAGAMVIIIFVLLINAVIHARAAIRDDLRRADITNLKHALEQYNNQYNHYGIPPAGQPRCSPSNDAASWLLGNDSPLLDKGFTDAIPHDVREPRHVYVFCATNVVEGKVLGYYLQAQLEVDQPDSRAFDEDESRKFHYRILHEDGKIFYRVCGGTETQCMPPVG